MIIHYLNKTYKLQCILIGAIEWDSDIEDMFPTCKEFIQIMTTQ